MDEAGCGFPAAGENFRIACFDFFLFLAIDTDMGERSKAYKNPSLRTPLFIEGDDYLFFILNEKFVLF